MGDAHDEGSPALFWKGTLISVCWRGGPLLAQGYADNVVYDLEDK